MSRSISGAERRTRLVVRHRLGSAASRSDAHESTPLEVTRSLVALHSSDPVSVYLSVLARSGSATIESVADALYRDRDLVRVHGMRRTLWVADIETAADIVNASAARLVQAERKRWATFLAEGGIDDPEAWIDDARSEILAFVAEAGLVDTQTIGDALPHRAIGVEVAAGKAYAATIAAHTRILLILGYEGLVVRAAPRGTWIASQYLWADPVSWLGRPLRGQDGETGAGGHTDTGVVAGAQAAVIDRYLLAFGPVRTDDVVWWTGWPKGTVNKALANLGAVEVDLDGDSGWLSPADAFEPESVGVEAVAHAVALLPALDPTTMGWRQRDHYLDPPMVAPLFDRNGNGGPTIWVGGRIVGGWAQRDDGDMAYRLLADVGADATKQIEQELDRLADGVGDTRYKIRFPNPLNAELRA